MLSDQLSGFKKWDQLRVIRADHLRVSCGDRWYEGVQSSPVVRRQCQRMTLEWPHISSHLLKVGEIKFAENCKAARGQEAGRTS